MLDEPTQIAVDKFFQGFWLEPYIDANQAYVKQIFGASFWRKCISKVAKEFNPVVQISTILGDIGIKIPLGDAIEEIVKLITEDQSSKNIVQPCVEQKLRNLAKKGNYFLGIREGERYGAYYDTLGWKFLPSNTLPYPRAPFLYNDISKVIGNVVIIDSCISRLEALRSYNNSIPKAVLTLDFEVDCVLTDYPFFLMAGINSFLPLKLSEEIKRAMKWLTKTDWYPYVRIIGQVKQTSGSPYVEVGLVFRRLPPHYADLEKLIERWKILIDIYQKYEGLISLSSCEKREKVLSELKTSPKWRTELELGEREFLFFRIPAIAKLIYELYNQDKCPSRDVRAIMLDILEVAKGYYKSKIKESYPETTFLDETLEFYSRE